MEEIYKVTEADLIGDIEGFPIEVVQMMMVRQHEQGRKSNISVFQRDRCDGYGGFVWYDTDEGSGFWSTVIDYKDFATFFERYPSSQSLVGLKKTKAIKTNRIKWTRQQLWVMERLPMIKGATLEQRIKAVGDLYYNSCYITSGFDMPVLVDEVNRALGLFGKRCTDDLDIFQKIIELSRFVQNELQNIRRMLYAFYDGNEIINLGIYTGIDSHKELMRYTKNWLKKNARVGRHIRSGISFYGKDTAVSVSAPRRECCISSSYTKDDDGFFNFNDRVIIGDMSYLIQ